MRLTNNARLPDAIVKAIQNDGYSKGKSDYTTTQLSKPSRIVALEKLHEDEITEDVADRIYALIGKLGHSILEQSGTADIIEKRLFWEIEGKILSGQVDVVDKSILEDWKFTSVWTSKDGVKPEWVAQASVNRFLCEKNGIPITEARNIAIYRDWSKPKALRDPSCPKHQVEVFHINMWSMEATEKWIRERIQSHESAFVSLPECTEDERWARDSKVAVMKKGRKSALKLCDSTEEAKAWISQNNEKGEALSLEDRPAESMHCLHYCACMPFCSQAKKLGITVPEKTEAF